MYCIEFVLLPPRDTIPSRERDAAGPHSKVSVREPHARSTNHQWATRGPPVARVPRGLEAEQPKNVSFLFCVTLKMLPRQDEHKGQPRRHAGNSGWYISTNQLEPPKWRHTKLQRITLHWRAMHPGRRHRSGAFTNTEAGDRLGDLPAEPSLNK